MSVIVELNDLTLTVASGDGGVRYNELAAASWDGTALAFGNEAVLRARSQPQQFNQRYFANLGAQPLPAPIGPAHNHADLIFHNLSHLRLVESESIYVGVPGHWNNDQLGLLLGITNELKLNVRGFVDIPLAHALRAAQAQSTTVVDLELHRLTATSLQRDGNSLAIADHRAWDGRGYQHIIEGWMSLIADEYVQRTRFDPLHSGDSEQQLLNQLNQWIHATDTGTDGNVVLKVERNNQQHELQVQSGLLTAKLKQRMSGLELPRVIAATHRLQNIPGLISLLEEEGHSVITLPSPEQVACNYQSIFEAHTDTGISRLQTTNVAPVAPGAPGTPGISNTLAGQVEQPAPVTHLLAAHIAQPLSNYAAYIDSKLLQVQPGNDVTVNGLRVAAASVTLALGDTVSINGKTHIAIALGNLG